MFEVKQVENVLQNEKYFRNNKDIFNNKINWQKTLID